MTKLNKALTYCIELIAAGREYPDASATAAAKFNVSIDALTEAYDNDCARG